MAVDGGSAAVKVTALETKKTTNLSNCSHIFLYKCCHFIPNAEVSYFQSSFFWEVFGL